MGQVVIELPQKVNLTYRFDDTKTGEKILKNLDDLAEERSKTPAIMPPRRNSLKEDGDAILGIWADRTESAEEIARKIRNQNNGKI